MSARYGSRTRTGEAVSGFGQRGAGGGTVEVTASASPAPAASSSPYTIDGIEYIVWTVTGNTTMSFTAPATATGEYLVVAGGAGAGGNGSYPNVRSAGGGAGGVHLGNIALANGPYPITIGAGGGGQTNGSPSTGFGKTALGGGRGGAWSPSFPVPAPVQAGQNGGCGGGGSNPSVPVAPRTGLATDPDQGRPGGYAGPSTSGGGGGAGEIGAPGTGNPYYMHGGDGIRVNFTGTVSYYAGGGAAGTGGPDQGFGGRGGGGNGGTPTLPQTNGTANTGGGGGGHSQTPSIQVGGSGGSGVVLIKYQRYQG